jgi:hypothetical protein
MSPEFLGHMKVLRHLGRPEKVSACRRVVSELLHKDTLSSVPSLYIASHRCQPAQVWQLTIEPSEHVFCAHSHEDNTMDLAQRTIPSTPSLLFPRKAHHPQHPQRSQHTPRPCSFEHRPTSPGGYARPRNPPRGHLAPRSPHHSRQRKKNMDPRLPLHTLVF